MQRLPPIDAAIDGPDERRGCNLLMSINMGSVKPGEITDQDKAISPNVPRQMVQSKPAAVTKRTSIRQFWDRAQDDVSVAVPSETEMARVRELLRGYQRVLAHRLQQNLRETVWKDGSSGQ